MSKSGDGQSDQSAPAELVGDAVRHWGPELRGRVAMVTGGARGLGRTLAEGLIEVGCQVAAADKSWSGAEDFRKDLEANGRTIALDLDITSQSSVVNARDAVLDRFGSVDVLINNAGLVSETLFAPKGHVSTLETKDEDWAEMFGVNVFGTVRVTREFTRSMLDRRRGCVINVVSSGVLMSSSGGAFYGARPWTMEMPYQASKAAITALTFYLAEELYRLGIAVNAFMPGHTRASWFDDTARAFQAEGGVYAMRPLVPEHVLPLVFFLSAQPGLSGEITTGRLYHVPDWNYDHGYGGVRAWVDRTLPADLDEKYRSLEEALPNYLRSGLARALFDAERVAWAAGMDKIATQSRA